jgi:undecaprenyl-diphosphatase
LIVFCASQLQYVVVVLLLLFVLLATFTFKDRIRIVFIAVASSVVARVLVEVIKHFFHRPRPFVFHTVHQLVTENSWSFPSGHATFFFALAMAIYLYSRRWGILFLICAVFISLGRIAAGIHYPSDILGGILLGIIMADFVDYLAGKIWPVAKSDA